MNYSRAIISIHRTAFWISSYMAVHVCLATNAYAYAPTPQLVRQGESLETKFEKLLKKSPGLAETYVEKASVLAKKTTNEQKRYILNSLRHTAESVVFQERMNQGVQNDDSMSFVASIYLDGTGKDATTLAEMDRMRKDLESIDPNARVTWALSDKFVFDEANRPQLRQVFEYVEKYGDEIGIGYGFANNQLDLEGWKKKMAEWMYMYRYNALNELHDSRGASDPVGTFRSIPRKYRPTSVTTYAINHEQAEWVRANFDIDAFFGWTATQYGVDQLSGEGSPLMPYWSNRNNPMVPAQSKADSSGNLFLNTITVDPVGCSNTDGESRWTIHPADPVTGGESQFHTIKQYLSNPYRSKNTSNYLSLFIDINWMLRDTKLENSWKNIVAGWPKDQNVRVMGIRNFGWEHEYRSGRTNGKTEFTLLFR